MSVLVRAIMDDAAMAVGDPGFTHVKQPEVLSFYNRTARRMAVRMRLLEYEAFFDIQEDDLYRLPEDCVSVRHLSFFNNSNWVLLREIFEDEFLQLTNESTVIDDPRRYLMRQGFFQLYPRPSAFAASSGRIVYWAIPPDVVDYSADLIPFADLTRDTLTQGVIVHLLKRLGRLDEAAAREQEWEDSMTKDRDAMEDRSRDRRTNLRARSQFDDLYGGQV